MSNVGDGYAVEIGILNGLSHGELVMEDVVTPSRTNHLSMRKPDQALLANRQSDRIKTSGTKSKRGSSEKEGKCFSCRMSGHYTNLWPHRVCNCCGAIGHVSRSCPEPASSAALAENPSDDYSWYMWVYMLGTKNDTAMALENSL